MRLTIVNQEGGQTAMAMYPNGLYAILETLDECQIPCGGGGYRHLAVSPNGVPADELQEALPHVIEKKNILPSNTMPWTNWGLRKRHMVSSEALMA